MAADTVLAPGDVQIVDLPGGKKGLKAVDRDGNVGVIPLDDANFMAKAIAAHKAAAKTRSNESGEAEERAYVEETSARLGLPKEAIR